MEFGGEQGRHFVRCDGSRIEVCREPAQKRTQQVQFCLKENSCYLREGWLNIYNFQDDESGEVVKLRSDKMV